MKLALFLSTFCIIMNTTCCDGIANQHFKENVHTVLYALLFEDTEKQLLVRDILVTSLKKDRTLSGPEIYGYKSLIQALEQKSLEPISKALEFFKIMKKLKDDPADIDYYFVLWVVDHMFIC